MRQSDYTMTPAPFSLYDEFGIPSSYPEGTAAVMVWLLAREARPDWVGLRRQDVVYDGKEEPGTLVVDMTRLASVGR